MVKIKIYDWMSQETINLINDLNEINTLEKNNNTKQKNNIDKFFLSYSFPCL